MTRFIVLLGAGAILAFLSASSASAQALVFDEYGNITLDGLPLPPGFVATDPLSGVSTLSYQLPFGSVNPGDMLVLEPPNFSFDVFSDMVRFPGNNQMFIFSDVEAGEPPDPGNLADLSQAQWPIRQTFGFVDEIGDEGNNSAFWNPGALSIGGIFGGSYGSVTYTFISDGTIPEPARGFVVVLIAGLILLGTSSLRWPPRAQSRR